MTKARYVVRCQQCGYLSPKWMGRCPDCGGWNTMVEEPLDDSSTVFKWKSSPQTPQQITTIPTLGEERYTTGIPEFDRVLGGGIVPGSLILIGGEPGVGKSTLLLQSSSNVAQTVGLVLLVSGEESSRQIRMRAERLGTLSENLYILPETDMERIRGEIEALNPVLLVIDSIQTMFHPDVPSAPGSVSQVRECTTYLLQIAKSKGLPAFLVGHVTKEGSIAGPRVLEHIVDTVLYFEGETQQSYRIIRAVKNRYGSTNEIGVFEMTNSGLREITDPSALFLTQRTADVSGSVVVATMEGTRPLLVELQALVTPSYLTIPRRLSTGLDFNRLTLSLAVLERRVGLRLENQDVYVNVAGGVRITEPGVDLGMILAVASARKNVTIPSDVVVFGEVGLTGEVRFVSHVERRLKESTKLGFKRAILPHSVPKDSTPGGPRESEGVHGDMEIFPVETVKQALAILE